MALSIRCRVKFGGKTRGFQLAAAKEADLTLGSIRGDIADLFDDPAIASGSAQVRNAKDEPLANDDQLRKALREALDAKARFFEVHVDGGASAAAAPAPKAAAAAAPAPKAAAAAAAAPAPKAAASPSPPSSSSSSTSSASTSAPAPAATSSPSSSSSAGSSSANAFCGECGQKLAPNSKFCNACGTPVGGGSAPAAAAAAKAPASSGAAASSGAKDENSCGKCGEKVGSGVSIDGLGKWHVPCFKCEECDKSLNGVSFTQSPTGGLICQTCQQEKYGKKCTKCKKPLEGTYAMVNDEPYHKECFVCGLCSKDLSSGFFMKMGKPLCKSCANS